MQVKSQQTNKLIAERNRRDMDSLRLYRPFNYQLPSFLSQASELLLRGGNRSAKSITGAAIVAAAARSMQLTGPDGKQLPPFCPLGRPLTIWVIGKGEAHISDTLYRLLFQKGQLPLFKDKDGKVRAARTWEERRIGDLEQKLVSEPFIPEWEVEGESYETAIAWKNKKGNFFDQVTMKNGTIIHAFTSSGDVKMGDPVDLIWIDEDIEYPKYVGEWQARLSDRKGRLLWTAWPWADNYALVRMSQRAEKQKDRPNPDVQECRLSFADNPLIDPDEKRKRYEAWSESGSAELKSRVDGEFSVGLSLMYPNFSLVTHGVPMQRALVPDLVAQAIQKHRELSLGWIPRDWTRYMSMDPGHSCTACIFLAVPPPEFGDFAVIFDELYLAAHDADAVAKKIRDKVAGFIFQDFVIDRCYSRQSISGMAVTYLDIYSKALAKAGVSSVASGSSFSMSMSDNIAGCQAVRDWMTLRDDGTPKLRVIGECVPNVLSEMQIYKKNFAKEEASDKPAQGQRDHAMDAMRYGVMHTLPYIPVPDPMLFMPDDPVMHWFKNEHQRGRGAQPHKTTTFHCGAGSVVGAA